MTREEFKHRVEQGVVLMDGATGSNLMAAGMPSGACPENWILNHPQVLLDLQKKYVESGSDIILAPTFTGNAIKLEEYGLEDQVEEINKKLVALSKEAAGKDTLVAADLSMTGKQLYPIGDLMFEDLVEVYKEQVRSIVAAGVDLFFVETMMSLQEARAAVLAIKETCDLPVMVSLTFEEDGRTLYGTTPRIAAIVLQSLGVDAIGMNCSTGPDQMLPLIKDMVEVTNIPVIAKPNAGLPILENGATCYKMQPDEFTEYGLKLVEAGVSIIGGCCGTTPEHIKVLAKAVKGKKIQANLKKTSYLQMLTSERAEVAVDPTGPLLVVGERINPTGKKALQQELREGKMSLVRKMAKEQEENGAKILDINMGMNGIDEKEMMLEAVYEVSSTVDTPLCIDSSYVEVIEAALRIYPGRALVNSVSLESEKIERLLPVIKKYGAMFILLPLSDEGLPKDAQEKREIIDQVVEICKNQDIPVESIVVDGLVATVGANKQAALECFETITYCREKYNLPTICGLSNISFGLPERQYVNSAFLTMAMERGLTLAIANPSQDLLMNMMFASDLLLAKRNSDISYIQRMQKKSEEKKEDKKEENSKEKEITIFDAVVAGDKAVVVEKIKKELARNTLPESILNEMLIPAINHVGDLFEKQIYFLPQLIASAKAMEDGIKVIDPILKKNSTREEKATIVFATVEGDIHDIGKNLVVLMLKNQGYHVIDLGKNVPSLDIVDTAIKENASIIGLSALMTTTMMKMKEVVAIAKEKGCKSKIIIGGAAINEDFADEIGADGYSKDAASCVKLVDSLVLSEK